MISSFILPVTHSPAVATTGEAHLARELVVSSDTPLPQVLELIERHLDANNRLVGQVDANASAPKSPAIQPHARRENPHWARATSYHPT